MPTTAMSDAAVPLHWKVKNKEDEKFLKCHNLSRLRTHKPCIAIAKIIPIMDGSLGASPMHFKIDLRKIPV